MLPYNLPPSRTPHQAYPSVSVSRYEAVRAEAKEQEATIKLNSDALDALIRIQAK